MGKSKKAKQQRSSNNSGNKSNNGSSNKISWNSQSKFRPESNSIWNDTVDDFPALGAVAASVPTVNVWEERKLKQEAIKALAPRSEYDEEAMLQQALALSMIEATQEEERRRKEAEEFISQVAALESAREEQEYFEASEEFVGRSEEESFNTFQPVKEYPKKSFLQSSSVSNSNQNVKTYSSSGAKPKINKVIERFGGWGLNEESVTTNSERLSDFVDDVVYEKSPKKLDKNDTVIAPNYQSNDNVNKSIKHKSSSNVSNAKEKKHEIISNPWEADEILYDENGTFTDNDDTKLEDSSDIQMNHTNKLPIQMTPYKVLDTWLSSEDDIWGSNSSNKVVSVATHTDLSNRQPLKDKHEPLFENVKSGIDTLYSPSENEYIKSSWPDHKEENKSSQNSSSTYNYDLNESSLTERFSDSSEPIQAPRLPAEDIWADKPSNASSFFTSYSNEHIHSETEADVEIQPMKFCSDIENEFIISNHKDDVTVPPILPPQPAPVVEEDKIISNEALRANSEDIPPILPPQPVPEVQPPFQPPMNNFLINPAAMFPAFNPLLMGGMDPITMRQMLMLSNPFFASQLLAMEQYYRSMGMPVDLFSLSSSMPVASVPGVMQPVVEQNTLANAACAPAGTSNSQVQNQSGNGSFMPASQSNNFSSEKFSHDHIQPPGLGSATSTSDSLRSVDSSSWHESYLSDDSSPAIPPPKPPPANVMSVPEFPNSSQSASSVYKNGYTHNNPYTSSIEKRPKPLSGIEACITKTEVTGWSDDEGDSFKTSKAKTTHGWGDEDGWGNDSVSAKSISNPIMSDNKKKTIYRQPSKQPMFSRYQVNKT